MGYFGGLGAGKGWHKFLFLITAEELAAVLQSEPLLPVTTNTRTTNENRYPEMDAYLRHCRTYLARLSLGAAIPWQVTSPLRVSLTHPGFAFTLHEFVSAEGELFGGVRPEEPIIELSPFEVYYDGKTLSTNVHTSLEMWFGFELDFPRLVFYAREGYAVERDASDSLNAAVFARLTAQIRSITKPCQIESPSRIHRTRIRISPAMREAMLGNPRLSERGLRVL